MADYYEPFELLKLIGKSLNNCEHEEADRLLNLFDYKFSGTPLTMDVIFGRLFAAAELAMRTGKSVNEAMRHIERNLNLFDSTPEQKVKMLLRAGQLETMTNRLHISPRYFSQALGIAEESGNEKLIAEVYQNISKMFAKRYPGLAIYFIRKAELKYTSVGLKKEAYLCRMERAMLYSIIVRTKVANPQYYGRFSDEATSIVNESLDPTLNAFETNHCQYIKSVVEANEEDLLALINGLDGIEALPNKCRYEDMYIGICLEKGLWDNAKQIYNTYCHDCIKLHGETPEIKNRLEQLEQLIQNKQLCQFIPFHLQRTDDEEVTLFDILDHYSIEDEGFALDKSILRSLMPSYEQEGRFEAIKMPDESVHLYPMGLAFNIYYRGQSQFFEPSYPSLYRNGIKESRVFVERMKYEELKRCIIEYPITEYFQNDILLRVPDGNLIPIKFSVDPLALAQHYGVLTELMDITTDKFVAAFFATTTCDKNGVYTPIITPQKEKGVLYRYWEIVPNYEKLRAVGLQPFSRPGEQCGLVYHMDKGENFNDVALSKDFFTHDPTVAEFIFNYTNRSKKLFPESPLTTHANAIAQAKKLSLWAYEEAKKEFYPKVSEEVLQGYLSEQGIELDENVNFSFSEEEKLQCRREWEEGGRDKTLSRIDVRLAYSGPISEV